MAGLTKIFPWLSIRNKLLIAFAGLSIIPVAIVGIYDIVSNVKWTKEIAFTKLTQAVSTIKGKTANFLDNVDADLLVLRNSSTLQRFITVIDSLPSKPDRKVVFDHACAEVLSFVSTKGIYYQIRMVSNEGDELFRVEDSSSNDGVRRYHIVGQRDLRSSAETYYFLLVENLKPGQIAFSPAELIGHMNDRIPVISFAMPIYHGVHRVGILIANVFTRDLFRILEPSQDALHGKIVLVSGDGYYLYHSEKKNAWNKLLASREEDNLRREYPSNIVTRILSGDDGVLDAGNEIISFAPLFTIHSEDRGRQVTSNLSIPLFVFESVPQKIILGPIYSHARIFAGLLVFFLAGAVGLGLLATQQFTKPIAAMQRGAEIITSGNYDHRLRIETRDEIEQLAEQFNVMAASLDAHEKEILRHRTTLEQMVRQRTSELWEEKAKLQAIVDNVPSAFVLLDKSFQIQSASAAFSKITGNRLEDVRGLDCHSVFCDGGFCHDCLCKQALSSGIAQSHIDEVHTADGHERFIEHVAIPMRENGETTSILEIITDITQRKRLEQNLIRTEKLMSAGEMSAIIAHEFRNALTSIKMILQLQHESKRLSRTDKRSVGVALDSLYHMEDIVTELLNFGRPSPMTYQLERIVDIIEESIAFVRLELANKRIRLTRDVDASLPLVMLDASHWKEAMINILLNAIQAIASKERAARDETISVIVKGVTLRKTYRDVDVVPLGEMQQGHPAEEHSREIELLKGTDCVLVEVNDTGPGIDEKTVGRIFDPFFTTKTNGTGLGLPMVKRTVNAHGGILMAKSKKGKGTTLTIYLPLHGKNKT